MKYSKNFERDWAWYYKWKDVFIFSGSPKKGIKQGVKYTAKEAFYLYDSQGKLEECSEPELLQQIFKCKESINFQIKEYAQDRAKGYLPKIEFEKIVEEFELLPWMIEAVEQQKFKYYKIEMADKEYIDELEAIVHFLAKSYEKNKRIYYDNPLKTCARGNPDRRDLTEAEADEITRFPLMQGHKLQEIVRKFAEKRKQNPKNIEKALERYENNKD